MFVESSGRGLSRSRASARVRRNDDSLTGGLGPPRLRFANRSPRRQKGRASFARGRCTGGTNRGPPSFSKRERSEPAGRREGAAVREAKPRGADAPHNKTS